MKRRNEINTLNQTIIFLQNKQTRELELFKAQLHVTYESLKPLNIIKNTFHEITSSPGIKNNVISNVAGLTTGYLAKKILIRSSGNPLKRIIGTLLEFAIAGVVAKNSGALQSKGKTILHNLLNHKNETKKELS
jgi:hypothetical protein